MAKASQELQMTAPAEDAWRIIRDPMDLSWLPIARSVDDLGGGRRRVLVDVGSYEGVDGDTLVAEERCFNVDDDARSYNYVYAGPELPIKDHLATLHIRDNGDGTSTFHWYCDWTPTADATPEIEREIATWVEQHWLTGMRNVKEMVERR